MRLVGLLLLVKMLVAY